MTSDPQGHIPFCFAWFLTQQQKEKAMAKEVNVTACSLHSSSDQPKEPLAGKYAVFRQWLLALN